MSTPESVQPQPDDAVPPAETAWEFDPLVDETAAPTLPEDDADGTRAPDGTDADDGLPASDPPDALVLEALARIEAKLGESQRLIDRQADVAARLHADNQALRAGELRKAQRGLVNGVLRVFDDVRRMADVTESPEGRADLLMVADALADALARSGVEQVAVAVGDPFDAKRHRVARVAPHDEATADRTVAEIVRPGFSWTEGDPVRATDVVVFKHTPNPAPQDPSA